MKKLNADALRRIKEKALKSYQTLPVKKEHQDVFLPACWVSATLEELNKLGLSDLKLDISSEDVVISTDEEY